MFVMLFSPVFSMPRQTDHAEKFDKHQRMDKLILKNQIGYHFKKVVREVSQELFVSRKIDVSALFLGINVIEHTSNDLSKFCSNLEGHIANAKTNLHIKTEFVHIKYPVEASLAEAQARCEARNMQ